MAPKRIISGIVALAMLAGMFPTSLIAGADDAQMNLTPSAPTGQLTITLKIKSTPDTPAAPTKASSTKNSVTLTAVEGCEYSKDGTTWQDSPEFTGLKPSTEYKFYQRVKETTDANASAVSPALTVATDADTYGLTITLVIHGHEWTYTAGTGDKANTITATCTGTTGTCDITEGLTMAIYAPTGDLTYDGTAKEATLNNDYNNTAFPGTYTIEYFKGETALNGAPVDAGDYTAKVTVGDATASVDYTISPASQTAPAVTAVNETISKKADGKITSVTDAMEYRKDGETTYTAVAENSTEITDLEAGKYYVRYKSDNNHNASDETEVTINAGRKLIATFKNEDGTTLQTVEVDYNAVPTYTGDTPTKEATAQYTYTFKGWDKTLAALTDDATYTATYDSAKVKYTVTAEKCEGGKVSADKTNVAWGETVTVTPKANDGYIIKGVYLNGKQMAVNDKGKYQFEMPKNNVKVTAVFEKKQFTVTATKPTNGTLTADKTNVAWGETVTVTPKANDGYVIKGVYLNGKQMAVNDKGKYQFEMPKNNVKVTAVFEKKQFTVTATKPTNGTLTADKTNVAWGETVTVTPKANDGYVIKGVYLNGKQMAVNDKGKYQFEMPKNNVKVTAVFEKKQSSIVRVSGDNRFATAAEISKKTFTKADTVVLTYGYNYADALAGVPLASKLNAPILLSNTDSVPSETLAEIKRLGAKKVIILGGTNAISEKAEKQLKAKKLTTQRIVGDTRFSTAVEIAKKINTKPTEVFLVYGYKYADALSVSTVAAIKGAPIVYLPKDGELDADTAAYLKSIKGSVKKAYVIGGKSIISDSVKNKASNALGLKSVQRIAGDDRYLTCLKVNETFKDLFTGSIVCAATGTNFPDALAGGVYAAKNKAPLLLVNTAADDLSKEQLSWLKAKDAKQVTVFGGTNSVSDKHAEKIAKARV